MSGLQFHRALLRLASRPAFLGRFQAVINRVSDEMNQGIGDLLNHGLVQLGIFADQFQPDIFADLVRQVADHARKFTEHLADRKHPRLHDRGLQIAGHKIQAAECLG